MENNHKPNYGPIMENNHKPNYGPIMENNHKPNYGPIAHFSKFERRVFIYLNDFLNKKGW